MADEYEQIGKEAFAARIGEDYADYINSLTDPEATPQQAAAMAKVSDGAIVGSAIIKPFAQYGPAAVPHIEAFVRDMAQAVHNA